jgi:pilus assembly protein Flp/PilA
MKGENVKRENVKLENHGEVQVGIAATGLFIRTQSLKRFLWDESGQDLVEYALVAVLIAMGATASMSVLATSVSAAFSSVGSHLGTYTT